jgi:hypothetical protein
VKVRRALNRRGILVVPLLVLSGAVFVGGEKPAEVGSPGSVVPPCFVPSHVDTAGWQVAHMFSRKVSFRLPSTFRQDSSARFMEGGIRWVDGDRCLEQVNGLWGSESFGSPRSCPGYSECLDTLAGVESRIITAYLPSFRGYEVATVPVSGGQGGHGYTEALICRSPDSLDQRLFLAIFRTLRSDSTWRLREGGRRPAIR